MTYKEHLRNNLIISVFIYLICCIAQKTLILTNFSDVGSTATAFLLLICNVAYYTIRYLDGDFSKKIDYYDKHSVHK